MLTMMRNMLRSKFAGLLFLLIIISMAVWGTTDIFAPRTGGDIIKAGERSLSMNDLNNTLELYLFQQRNQGGTVLTREQAVESGVVDQLFAYESSRTSILGYSTAIGATATEETVVDLIRSSEDFANPETGVFDIDIYQRALRRLQRSQTQHEQIVEDELSLNYVMRGALAALQPPAILSRIRAIQLAESRQISWFTVDPDAVGTIDPPSDEQLEAYYSETEPTFRIPELRTVDVISLTANDFVHSGRCSGARSPGLLRSNQGTTVLGARAAAFHRSGRRFRREGPHPVRPNWPVAPRYLNRQTLNWFSLSPNAQPCAATWFIEELAEGLFAPSSQDGTVVGPVELDGLWIVARVNAVVPGEPIPFEDVRTVILEEGCRLQKQKRSILTPLIRCNPSLAQA